MFFVPAHPEPYAIDASTSRHAHEQALNSHTEIHGGGHHAISSKLNTKPRARRLSPFGVVRRRTKRHPRVLTASTIANTRPNGRQAPRPVSGGNRSRGPSSGNRRPPTISANS